jgi:hypothetical protein
MASGKWVTLSFLEQMAHIGSEVFRALSWKSRNEQYSVKASDRALELLSLTLDDARHTLKLRELARLYEVMADYFYFDNTYGSSEKLWNSYFFPFTYAASLERERRNATS